LKTHARDVSVVYPVADVGTRFYRTRSISKTDVVERDSAFVDQVLRTYLEPIGLECLDAIGNVDQVSKLERVVPAVFVYPPGAVRVIAVSPDEDDGWLKTHARDRPVVYSIAGIGACGKVQCSVVPERGIVVVHPVGVNLDVISNLEPQCAKRLDAIGNSARKGCKVKRLSGPHVRSAPDGLL
jgi:hypothetical protein